MTETKKYWKGLEELTAAPQFVEQSQKEFAEHVPVDQFLSDSEATESKTHRRDFLKYLGFSITAASLAACETPVTKAIPYLNKPEEITPGVANFYASTYFDGFDFAGVVVKTREGRPIFIKGNKHSAITGGALNARVNASVLELYDAKRGKAPAKKAAASWQKGLEWSTVDKEITGHLSNVSASGGKIVVLTGTLMSPSSEKAIADLAAKFPGVEHVVYDSISSSGILKANKMMFGKAVIPSYRFDKSKVIVSIGADFLGGWLNSNQYAAQYALSRKPEGEWMSKHFQFETKLSLTGSNADVRATLKPSENGIAAAYLLKAVGGNVTVPAGLTEGAKKKLNKAAAELKAAAGHGLVVSGSNDSNVQLLVNAINKQLGNYGNTVDVESGLHIRKGNDTDFAVLVNQMAAGSVGAILIAGVNPVYSSPAKIGDKGDFKSALAKVKVKIYLGDRLDETGAECDYICPDNHYLESWNDFNPTKGIYNIAQPAINKLFNTRQWQESILAWSGNSTAFGDYVQEHWSSAGLVSGNVAWHEAVQNGVYVGHAAPAIVETTETKKVEAPKTEAVDMALVAAATVTSADINFNEVAAKFKASAGWEVELYVKAGMGDGRHALNPWLQELPDPITKVTWDNYATMHPEDVKELFGITGKGYEGHNELYLGEKYPAKVIKIKANGVELEVPVYPLPGQARQTVSVALGYGRSITSGIAREEWQGGLYKEGALIGVNAFPLISKDFLYSNSVEISKTDNTYPLATTQTHHTMMGRKIVNETTLDIFKSTKDSKAAGAYNEQEMLTDTYGKKRTPAELDLWEDQGIDLGHRWGMVIDLNTCIGCGACATACQSENNVPVVGKDEVRRSREMHWIRIDRYFSSTLEGEKVRELDQLNSIAEYHEAEVPDGDDELQVVYQPVMCQHCNHAPCETVCPVAATTHSQEGLNQMAYNRCIGTRYCANNCPFKVRRFNWFQYDSLNLTQYPDFNKINPAHDDLGRMVLNPDVVVRSRGVIEKCSMCVQRIQHGKLEAKKAGHAVEDGSIETACAEACPTHAIQFGDLNDVNSYVHKASKDQRSYTMLDEVGVKPNVYYQTKVRNLSKEA